MTRESWFITAASACVVAGCFLLGGWSLSSVIASMLISLSVLFIVEAYHS